LGLGGRLFGGHNCHGGCSGVIVPAAPAHVDPCAPIAPPVVPAPTPEKKLPEGKPEDKKPEDKKPEDKKPEDKKVEA
jgi:hypothetical protein